MDDYDHMVCALGFHWSDGTKHEWSALGSINLRLGDKKITTWEENYSPTSLKTLFFNLKNIKVSSKLCADRFKLIREYSRKDIFLDWLSLLTYTYKKQNICFWFKVVLLN